jgi:hypothetical protein
MKRLLAILVLCLASMAAMVPGTATCGTSSCTVYNQATVIGYTGDPLQIGWGCTACATNLYEHVVEMRRFPPRDTDVPIQSGKFAYNVFTWNTKFPKVGTYYVRIKDCLIGKRDDASCSVWGNSYDLQTTEPIKFPRGFTINSELKPPTL